MSSPTIKPSDLVQPDREKLPEFEVTGICDADCTALAKVKVRLKPQGSLVFCGHHYRAKELDLIPVLMDVYDESGWEC